MAETTKKSKLLGWADELDQHVRTSGKTWSDVAAAMDMTEGGIRHWRNGTREIKLTEFVKLCRKAGADPVVILQASLDVKKATTQVEAAPRLQRDPPFSTLSRAKSVPPDGKSKPRTRG